MRTSFERSQKTLLRRGGKYLCPGWQFEQQFFEDFKVELGALVEIEVGMERCGIMPGKDAAALARRIADAPGLKFRGLQAYHGRAQHLPTQQQRAQAIASAIDAVRETLEALAADNLKCEIIGGAGTGTFTFEAQSGVYNELQVGSYVFMDHEYNICDLRGLDKPTFEQALQIDARVVSANTPGMVTVDAGLKAMATEKGPPMILKGAVEGSTTRFMGDEHLAVIAPEGKVAPALAEQVILTPPHCDPTVNLYESYHVVKGDTLVEIWPVTARGRSR